MIIRCICLVVLVCCLTGCFSVFYYITAPIAHLALSKPNLYYSFSIAVDHEGIVRTFNKSVLCRHYIGFGANGWWDYYVPDATDIVFEDRSRGVSWQLHGIACPDYRTRILGIYRRDSDGKVQFLGWLNGDHRTFRNDYTFERSPKYEVATKSTTLFNENQIPVHGYTYILTKLKGAPKHLAGVKSISVLSSSRHRLCDPSHSKIVLEASDAPRQPIEYIKRGVLDYDGNTHEWRLSEPRAGNRFIDVELIDAPTKEAYKKIGCLTINYGGAHTVRDHGQQEIYDPNDNVRISFHQHTERSLYLSGVEACKHKAPVDIDALMSKYPDYYEVKIWWEAKYGNSPPMKVGGYYVKINGKVMCVR